MGNEVDARVLKGGTMNNRVPIVPHAESKFNQCPDNLLPPASPHDVGRYFGGRRKVGEKLKLAGADGVRYSSLQYVVDSEGLDLHYGGCDALGA